MNLAKQLRKLDESLESSRKSRDILTGKRISILDRLEELHDTTNIPRIRKSLAANVKKRNVLKNQLERQIIELAKDIEKAFPDQWENTDELFIR